MLTSGASKIKALPSFEAFEYNRSLSLTAMLASEGKAMRRSVSVPAFGKDAPVVANSLKSTMNYAKLRKLAKEDQRYGPSSDDLERSDLMSGILNGLCLFCLLTYFICAWSKFLYRCVIQGVSLHHVF